MKKIAIVIFLLMPIFFFSCLQNNDRTDDPKATLSKFFKDLSDKDITAARKITTQDSQFMLDGVEADIKANKDSKAMEKFSKENLEVADAKTDDDRARILVTEKATGKEIYYVLKKENNNWKVHLDEAAMLVESFDELMQQGINPGDSIAKIMQELREAHADTTKNKFNK
ncbi:MAG: DUF4878 domain-containing protein [Ferruginibacter sp.]